MDVQHSSALQVQEGSKQILSLLLNNARGKHSGPDALKVFRLLLNSYLSTLLSITKNVSHHLDSCTLYISCSSQRTDLHCLQWEWNKYFNDLHSDGLHFLEVSNPGKSHQSW